MSQVVVQCGTGLGCVHKLIIYAVQGFANSRFWFCLPRVFTFFFFLLQSRLYQFLFSLAQMFSEKLGERLPFLVILFHLCAFSISEFSCLVIKPRCFCMALIVQCHGAMFVYYFSDGVLKARCFYICITDEGYVRPIQW